MNKRTYIKTLESNIEARVLGVVGDLPLNSITSANLQRVVHKAVHEGVSEVLAKSGVPILDEVTAQGRQASEPAQEGPRGEKVRAVWDELDRQAKRDVPTLAGIREAGKRKGWNANTTRVQFYRWRAAQ